MQQSEFNTDASIWPGTFCCCSCCCCRSSVHEAPPNKVNFYQDSTAFYWASCLCFSPCYVSPTAEQKQHCTPCVHCQKRAAVTQPCPLPQSLYIHTEAAARIGGGQELNYLHFMMIVDFCLEKRLKASNDVPQSVPAFITDLQVLQIGNKPNKFFRVIKFVFSCNYEKYLEPLHHITSNSRTRASTAWK